jgi:hypothetical protein
MQQPAPVSHVFWVSITFEGGLGVVALLVGWLIGFWPLDGTHWDTGQTAWGVAACLPLLAILILSRRFPIGPLAELKRTVSQLVGEMFAGFSVLQLALVSLAAGVGEELLFRGVVQRLASEHSGETIGLVVGAIAFAIAHPMSKSYIVLAGLIGLYLGWLWIYFEHNLLVPMLVHGLYDFLALVYLMRERRAAA